MNECIKDCLSCSNSMSIPAQESDTGGDELFCTIKKKIVDENDCCKNYN